MTRKTEGERHEAARLQVEIQGRLNGRVHQLRLVVRGAGLVLQGQARTYYAKQLAQQAVLEMTRIPIVANEIEVL